jgi:ketosteroid isomerase-like protein
MTSTRTSHPIVDAFVGAWNRRELTAFGDLLHSDFKWHIAVTDYDDPKMRPLHSKLLAGKNLQWEKSIYDRAETLEIFGRIFGTTSEFGITPTSVIADGDRIAVELVGRAKNQTNGRRYDNLYCYIFHILDGKIILFREYQDTLLLFDVWVAD